MEEKDYTGIIIKSDKELEPVFTVYTVNNVDVNDSLLDLKQYLAKILSYLFQIPLPAPTPRLYCGRYIFPKEDIYRMELQLDDVSLSELEDGSIRLSTLLLLSNSPHFPYNVYRTTDDDRRYYELVLKKDIFKSVKNMI